jgi:hypothetical protein
VRPLLVLHVVAGSLALLSGYVALYSGKGGRVHRKGGMLFVYAMLAMATLGTLIAAGWDVAPLLNVPAGLIAAYLVVTGLTTVRPLPPGSPAARGLAIGAMLLALGVGTIELTIGLSAAVTGSMPNDLPPFPFFLFGTIGVLAGAGDFRILRQGPLAGTRRLARHLWRMSFALLIAAMSFFFGQADELPQALRIPALLALPVLAVLVTLLYWLWRVRARRSLRGLVVTGTSEAA